MNTNLIGALWVLMLGSAVAGPAEERKLRDPLGSPTVAMPISIDGGDPRSGLQLRDALRQPFDSLDDPFQPYRLSAEERQRMREQLRSQPVPTQHKK